MPKNILLGNGTKYESTSLIYKKKRIITGMDFRNKNIKKNPMFLKKEVENILK